MWPTDLPVDGDCYLSLPLLRRQLLLRRGFRRSRGGPGAVHFEPPSHVTGPQGSHRSGRTTCESFP